MNATLEIFQDDQEGPRSLLEVTDMVLLQSNGSFIWTWNTSGLQTGIFHIEGRLTDIYGNMEENGARPGMDLSMRIVDLTPPVIGSISYTFPVNDSRNMTASVGPGSRITRYEWAVLTVQPLVPEVTTSAILAREASPWPAGGRLGRNPSLSWARSRVRCSHQGRTLALQSPSLRRGPRPSAGQMPVGGPWWVPNSSRPGTGHPALPSSAPSRCQP